MSQPPTCFSPIPESSLISGKTRARFLAVVLVFLRLPLIDHPQPVHPDELEFVEAINFPTPYPVHPPGYPLWTAMGTVVSKVSRGEYQAYQILSVIGAAAASVFLYQILRRWVCADGVAWLIALAMGLNPLMWFHAVTALNYCMGAAAALAIVYFMARSVMENRPRDLKIGTAILAFCSFLRPDLLLWIGPVWAALALRHPSRIWGPAALVLAAGAVANWQMTHYLYGQSETGRMAMAHTREVIFNTSVFKQGVRDGLLRNAMKLGANLAWDFGLLLPAIPIAWIGARRLPGTRAVKGIALLAALPLIAFTVLIHMSEPGHVMLLLPVGYAVLASGLAGLTPEVAKRLAFVIAVVGAAQFLLYPWSPDSTGAKRLVDAKIGYMSAAGLRQIDRRRDIHQPGDYWPTGASHAGSTTRPEVPRGFGPAPLRPPPSPQGKRSQTEALQRGRGDD